MTLVCLVHTVPSLPAVFDGLVAAHVPGVRVMHLVDEGMLADTVAHGMLPRTLRRLVAHAAHGEESGAQAVLVTCSSLGEATELARPFLAVPVYRVDAPMAAQAVAEGTRIAVLATLHSTLDPTRRLVEREAARQGRPVRLVTSLCDGAFQALRAGRPDEHDAVVTAEAARLAADADVLVLAQASMARAVGSLPPGRISVPVLSSLVSGVGQLRRHAVTPEPCVEGG
ncbi:MAG TPA: aspartate/glutamate racemase family protein [Micromonosporaceae bacterium]|nr:aspartate/glutamate racemase family protein [Micromonosporaceae bacterium]